METIEQIVTEALFLAKKGGIPLWILLVFVLVAATAIVLLRDVKLNLPPASPPEPTAENDGGGPPVPPAEFDSNVQQNTDPNAAPPG